MASPTLGLGGNILRSRFDFKKFSDENEIKAPVLIAVSIRARLFLGRQR